MRFQLFAPPPDLAPWVAVGVHVTIDSPSPAHVATHMPALVEGGLTVVLEGGLCLPSPAGGFATLPPCLVSGARPEAHTLYRTPRLRCVGLRLHPAGLAALLGDSPSVLPVPVSAGDVWGLPWSHGLERVQEARGDGARIAALFDFVRGWLRRQCRPIERTRRAWHLQAAVLDLAGAGPALGVTHRQFERNFEAAFGMRPKLFQRVARLEGLLRAAIPGGRTDAQLALEHGYYDQSHLGKDLRLLAGASLTTLVEAVRSRDESYWPLTIGTQAASPAMSVFS